MTRLVNADGVTPSSIGWRHHSPDIVKEVEQVSSTDKRLAIDYDRLTWLHMAPHIEETSVICFDCCVRDEALLHQAFGCQGW
jgi:hypothetical protein